MKTNWRTTAIGIMSIIAGIAGWLGICLQSGWSSPAGWVALAAGFQHGIGMFTAADGKEVAKVKSEIEASR